MQPYIFPYIGYFQLINAVDKFVILDDVNFINKGWINRNNILVNGKANLFTIPLKEASQNKLINEIDISSEAKWKTKLLKSIELSYKKAPNFLDIFFLVEDIIKSENYKISDLIVNSLKQIIKYLDIKTEIVSTSSIYANNGLKAQDRIIDICIKENASEYINPIGGIELYNIEEFKKNQIELNFLKSNSITYHQYKFDFVPWLSIIDVMMFNSLDQTKQILNQYELI